MRLIRLNLQFACVSIFVYVLFEYVFLVFTVSRRYCLRSVILRGGCKVDLIGCGSSTVKVPRVMTLTECFDFGSTV